MKLVRFILALTIISFVGCRDISDKLSSESTDTEVAEDIDEPDLYLENELLEEESEVTEALETNNETVVETTDATKIVKEVVKEAVIPGKFYIIAGSFKDFQKAENLYKELSAKGYSESKILDPVNNFSRVVIRSFNNEDLARGELKKLRKQYNDESIWMFKAQ